MNSPDPSPVHAGPGAVHPQAQNPGAVHPLRRSMRRDGWPLWSRDLEEILWFLEGTQSAPAALPWSSGRTFWSPIWSKSSTEASLVVGAWWFSTWSLFFSCAAWKCLLQPLRPIDFIRYTLLSDINKPPSSLHQTIIPINSRVSATCCWWGSEDRVYSHESALYDNEYLLTLSNTNVSAAHKDYKHAAWLFRKRSQRRLYRTAATLNFALKFSETIFK